MWFYVVEDATGRLLSETDQEVAAGSGRSVVSRPERADSSVMWDEVSRAFIPRPPKVLVDRIADLEGDSVLSAVWTRLTTAQRTALRNRLGALLGSQRLRGSGEPVNLP